MRKLISFMHISLDGFVAGPNGEMDWIKMDDELFQHVEKRISKGDTALYGRTTYQMMESYWPGAADQPGATRHDIAHAKWYKNVRKIVLSGSLSAAGLPNTVVISGKLSDKIGALKNAQGGSEEDILIFGSPRATHALMQEGLVDGFWLFVNPVLLGQGISLFKNVKGKIALKLNTANAFGNGVTELNYTVEKN